MKKILIIFLLTAGLIFFVASKLNASALSANILFLHHSTGADIWNAGPDQNLGMDIHNYNAKYGTRYTIKEEWYKRSNNNPFDYWEDWGKPIGIIPNNTLNILANQYNVIMFKHCFPVGYIEANTGQPNVASSARSLENYYLQYNALKAKMRSLPNTKFIVWTGAALTQKATNPQYAQRAQTFFNWVKTKWDQPGDNIYVWDFNALETRGSLYMRDEYAKGPTDSHPNAAFSAYAEKLLLNRLINVIQGRGDSTSITGY